MRRMLQVALATIGAVATAAGAHGVLRGGRHVRGGGPVSPSTDSELRFYASWYSVMGVLMLRAARRPEREALTIRACAAGFLLGALGRRLSARAVGSPDPLFRVLTVVELAIAAVLVPWQALVASRGRGAASAPDASSRP